MKSVPQQLRLRNTLLSHETVTPRPTYQRILSVLFLPVLVLIALAGCGGGNSVPPPPPPPSNLQYAQSTINATVGVAVSIAAPTVTGTVSSYAVSPALPTGLSLSASTGAISGTPTTVTAQATYTVTASNSSGSTNTSLKIAVNPVAPSNLVYPQTSITAVVGQSISQDVPTVSGTVTSFTVNPALPAGLSLSASTGTISGTPTTVTTQATYTVTASNAGGSTTAGIQITVNNPAPPSNLVYPQTSIGAVVGESILEDIPSVSGSVTSFTVNPALPAGLSMNASTGTISGTPSSAAAQMAYTVTAANPGGNTTAKVTITVMAGPVSQLAALGALDSVGLRMTTDRVLNIDKVCNWVLWDYHSGALVGQGSALSSAALTPVSLNCADIEGSTLGVAIPNGLEIRSAVDAHLEALIAYPGLEVNTSTWWQLASDGSYAVIGSSSGLSIYGLTGNLIATKSGDYSKGMAYGSPSQVMVANGGAGAHVIEYISIATGVSTVSAQFLGAFDAWFLDGQSFVTNSGSSVWVYSNAGVLTATMSFPSGVNPLGGQGNWVYSGREVYAIGSSTAALSLPAVGNDPVIASKNTIAVLDQDNPLAWVVDLSGSTPTVMTYTLPSPLIYLQSFASLSASGWVMGNVNGAVLDGASLATTTRYFGEGGAQCIAAGSGNVAVATSIGTIDDYDPSGPTLLSTINFQSAQIAVSSSGSVLGAMGGMVHEAVQRGPLNFYSLPSGSTISSLSFGTTFTLAADGGIVSQLAQYGGREVTPISGSPVIYTDGGSLPPIQLSPDGTLIAANVGNEGSAAAVTSIYKNGTLQATVPGVQVVWLDNGRLLVDQSVGTTASYAIVGPDGTLLSSPQIPLLASYQQQPSYEPVYSNSDLVYNPYKNRIYSLSTGNLVWQGAVSTTGIGAISGPYVLYATWDNRILREQY